MAGRPLRPATDHRLGRPLPHQLANRPQAPPKARPKRFPHQPSPATRAYAELPRVSRGYPPPRGRLPTCSSPVRHVSRPKATPFDLHALGTPPALILSQDQTLHQDPPKEVDVLAMFVRYPSARSADPQARVNHVSVGKVPGVGIPVRESPGFPSASRSLLNPWIGCQDSHPVQRTPRHVPLAIASPAILPQQARLVELYTRSSTRCLPQFERFAAIDTTDDLESWQVTTTEE